VSGIIVGVDGSGHSQRVLEWAMKESGIWHAPLTVLTVHAGVRGYYASVCVYPDDPARTAQAQQAAQAQADQALAAVDGPRPESVTVRAVHGIPVEELVSRAGVAAGFLEGTRVA
jgi:hypothetical protein